MDHAAHEVREVLVSRSFEGTSPHDFIIFHQIPMGFGNFCLGTCHSRVQRSGILAVSLSLSSRPGFFGSSFSDIVLQADDSASYPTY